MLGPELFANDTPRQQKSSKRLRTVLASSWDIAKRPASPKKGYAAAQRQQNGAKSVDHNGLGGIG